MKYVCSSCDGYDCKLWRQSNTFLNHVKLICWECLEAKGLHVRLHDEYPTDQIYEPEIDPTNYLPAVPDLEGGMWGYTSVPSWWCAWWKGLPDKPSHCRLCCGAGHLGYPEKYKCYRCDGTGKR